MNCEICGKELKGPGVKIIVEGTELTVCSTCKKYGSEKVSTASQSGAKRVVIKKKKVSTDIEFKDELLDNYNQIIRQEREKRGWSQEQLAKKIQEKESLIKKIENAEITPDPEVVAKLEKLFGIKLKESVPVVKLEKRSSMTPTLGDVVVLKKKEK
ncbi:MAG: multiprotein bridging factor aMBF1 [Archaeoglobaceae archaeon]|nr:multiprotein bridging factor aMBF1 [Archaeoglobaceae archaeon]MDW8118686.1 multiprotein bridging factor aMBF1 [Archaeoglobaceae archaeon]